MQVCNAILFLFLISSVSCVVGASLGGGEGIVARLEREAERDEKGADREAARAEKLDKELGESGMATRYKKLQREIDEDGRGGHDSTASAGERNEQPLDIVGAGVPGETAIESLVKEGMEAVTAAEDIGSADDTVSDPKDNEDKYEPRDLIAEAEVEGGCLGDCEGTCTSKCHNSPLIRSKGDLEKCRQRCEQQCVASCRDQVRKTPRGPNLRAARMKRRQKATAGREMGSEQDASTGPGKKWGWQERMEDEEASGKSMEPAPMRGKPMDEECKTECMGSCQRKCKKKSRSPDKCPAQCKEQCEDDCYIAESGAPPDADVFMPGNGEEGLGDEPNRLMKRCMGECHEQCMPPCSERGDAASGLKQTRRQAEIAIHLNCSQACRGSCLSACEPMVARRVEDIRQDLRNREHKFFGKDEPRPAGSDPALSLQAEQPSADEVVAAARFSGFGDFGFQPDRPKSRGLVREGAGARGLKERQRRGRGRGAEDGFAKQYGGEDGALHWSGKERDDEHAKATSVDLVSVLVPEATRPSARLDCLCPCRLLLWRRAHSMQGSACCIPAPAFSSVRRAHLLAPPPPTCIAELSV